jgi:arylsulfatase A-like enzyme
VFLSDHGEEFLDHGDWVHGHTLFDELVRVPLSPWGAAVDQGHAGWAPLAPERHPFWGGRGAGRRRPLSVPRC